MAHAARTFVTGVCRLSFPSLFTPSAYLDNAPKYSATLLFKKGDDTFNRIQQAAKEVVKETWPEGPPKGVEHCVIDGNTRDYDGYEDMLFVSAKATPDRPPTVLNEKVQQVFDPSYMYPGCYVRAEISVYCNKGWKKVCVGLNHIQRVREGDRLGGKRSNPEEIFEAVPMDGEDGSDGFDTFDTRFD